MKITKITNSDTRRPEEPIFVLRNKSNENKWGVGYDETTKVVHCGYMVDDNTFKPMYIIRKVYEKKKPDALRLCGGLFAKTELAENEPFGILKIKMDFV
jgi:hypothetical protein